MIKQWFKQQLGIVELTIINISSIQKQQLTHQQIKGQFIEVQIDTIPTILQHYQWISSKQLLTLAFPKYINQYIESRKLKCNLF